MHRTTTHSLRLETRRFSRLASVRIVLIGCIILWTGGCGGEPESIESPSTSAVGDSGLDSVLSSAARLHQERNYDEGILLLEGALGDHSRSPELHYNLGVMRGSMNDHEGAVRDFEQTLLLDPAHDAAHRALANAYTRLGDLEMSLPHLEHCLRADPGDSACRWLLGSNLSGLGRTEEAAEHLEQAAVVRRDANSWFELGLARRRLGQLEPAAYAFSMALGIDELHLPSLLNYGQVLTALGRKEDGATLLETHQHLAKMFDRIETLERMTAGDDASPGIYLELAELNLARNEVAEAEECYRDAVARYGELPPLALGLSALLIQENRSMEAESLVRGILSEDPKSAPGYFLLGMLALDGDRLGAAEDAFATSMELYPWTPDLFVDLGSAYRDRALYGPSEKALRAAVRLDPGNPMAQFGLALTLTMQDRPREAEFVIRQTLELEPSLPDAWEVFGILRAEQGDREGATRALVNSLELRRPELLRQGGPEQIEKDFLARTKSQAAREIFQDLLAQLQAVPK